MKYLILADDYTGANDTGVQMSRRGLPVSVMPWPISELPKTICVVVDSETRNLNEEDALKTMEEIETFFQNTPLEVVYKKVDSTLRGNIKAELKALAKSFDTVIFAPAYPDIGRRTKNGIQELNGVPLMDTEVAKDPFKPIQSDELVNYLEGVKSKVAHFKTDKAQVLERDVAYYADALTQEDLKMLVQSVGASNRKILWVGSAGLAQALFEKLIPAKPVLATVGSLSQVAVEQMDYLQEMKFPIISIKPQDFFKDGTLQEYKKEMGKVFMRGQSLCLTAARNRPCYELTVKAGEAMGMSPSDITRHVQGFVAKLVAEVIGEFEVGGIFLTGGDTAMASFRSLKATGSRIISETEPGFILSRLEGGPYEGLPIITKAGAFGRRTSILESIEILQEEAMR